VDAGQSDHFEKIFDVAQQAGWYVPNANRLDHVGVGLVFDENGKRVPCWVASGDVLKLSDFLDYSVAKAKAALLARRIAEKKNEEKNLLKKQVEEEEESQTDLDEAAAKLGAAAVKYSISLLISNSM
jgi:arginyl-tRNA synthetase